MRKAVITDHSFEAPDVEQAILEPHGCSVVSQRAFTDQDALIDLRTSVANTVAAAIRGEKLPNVVNGVSA